MDNVSGINHILAQLKAASELAAGSNRPGEASANPAPVDFGQLLKSAVDQVNTVQNSARQLSRDFAQDNPNVNLHEVMISLQKASISFQSMIQVRNRLVSAYQEIMNMQV